MFRAVREWWRSGRGKDTARLFVFELTVVMIGVLAAQQVSNWASNRAALRQVEGLHGDLLRSFDAYRAIAAANRVAIPCLNQRVDLILRLANERRGVGPALFAPAPLVGMAPDSISPADEQLLRQRYGDNVGDTIGSIEFNLKISELNGTELEKRWFEFHRLNPQSGPVSDADRSAVRQVAVEIKGNLFALAKSSETLLRLISKLDVPHRPEMTIKPVASCGEMWRSGKGFVEDGRA